MNPLTWQNPEQLFVAQVLKKIFYNSVAELRFKSYTSNDNLLLPPCLGDFIPRNDPVRVVHRIIEQINLEALYRKYSPKGCSAYHPRMMLQILVYAFA